MVTKQDVIAAYELILQRSPESDDVINHHLRHADVASLGRNLLESKEFALRHVQGANHEHHVYRGYNAGELALFRSFSKYKGSGQQGFVTNFLGNKTRCALQAPLLPFDGQVEDYPEPVGNTQAETAEWLGILRAVAEAGDRFRMLELGAGFGPWMATTHCAAHQRNIRNIHVYGVEGDAQHVAFIRVNMADNDIAESDFTAIHGAVGAADGVAYWPVEKDSSEVYGGRMIKSGSNDYLGNREREVVEVPVIGIDGLLEREPMWDLVHIDIQGHEGEVCTAGITRMTDRVRRVVIGTHSRVQDGIVMSVFHKAGWALENEKPTIAVWNSAIPTVEGMALVDGAQVWRNPGL